MKLVKGWKILSHEGGFLNEVTGQTLVIAKKEFSAKYQVLLFSGKRTEDAEGKKISPDFVSRPKAEVFAMDWMKRNPNGAPSF
jgi:hypothetical protein